MIRPDDLALDLEHLAKRLRSEGAAALDHARNCRPGIASASTDGVRSGGRPDPTARQALDNRKDPAATLLPALIDALLGAHNAVGKLDNALDRCVPTRTDRETAIDLAAMNARSGYCQVCTDAGTTARHHTGRAGDRLRAIPTHDAETPMTLACAACRKSWERRPYSGHGDGRLQPYAEWRAERISDLARTTRNVAGDI